MGRLALTLALSTSAVFGACDKGASSKVKEPGTATTTSATLSGEVEKAADIFGVWTLDKIVKKIGTPEEVAIKATGITTWTFRANGTYFFETNAFSLYIGSDKPYDSCTMHGSGRFAVARGSATLTSRILWPLKGTCHDFVLHSNNVGLDQTAQVALRGPDNLTITIDIDGGGVDPLTYVLVRSAPETWTGEGADPRFTGEWKLVRAYGSDYCPDPESAINFVGEGKPNGTYVIDRDADSFKEEAKDLIGDFNSDACSAKATGSFSTDDLTHSYIRAVTEKNECLGLAIWRAYVGTYLDSREVVSVSGQWILTYESKWESEDCKTPEKEVQSTGIYVFDRVK